MEQEVPGLAFVQYGPPGCKKKKQRAHAVRVHAGKVGWLKSSQAAQVEAKRRHKELAGHKEGTPEEKRKDNKDERAKDAAAIVLRPVSPVFGGLSVCTFDTAADASSSQIGYLMLTAVWPNTAGDGVAAEWFEDFCNDTLMFHTHCTSGAMYRDVIAQKAAWSCGPVTLTHKAKTLSLIKSSIENIDTLSRHQIECLALSIGILGVHDFQSHHTEHKELPLRPHFPTSNWLSLWGRTDPVEAHFLASVALTKRLGGPKALELPGLGFMCGLSDMFRASVRYCKPVFECFWDDAHILDIMPEDLVRPPKCVTRCPNLPALPGTGFANLPGGLPLDALSVFTEVAYLDKIMARHSPTKTHTASPSKDHPADPALLQRIQCVRLATCHKLLSLPFWDELPTKGDQDQYYPSESRRTIYELCRLICVIYSNAVFCDTPPHNGWNSRHTSRAIDLLETSNLEMWTSNVDGLYLWILFIGGMAAYGTENRTWFEGALYKYVRRKELTLERTMEMAGEFVWSESTCGVGARELWGAAMHEEREGEAGK